MDILLCKLIIPVFFPWSINVPFSHFTLHFKFAFPKFFRVPVNFFVTKSDCNWNIWNLDVQEILTQEKIPGVFIGLPLQITTVIGNAASAVSSRRVKQHWTQN